MRLSKSPRFVDPSVIEIPSGANLMHWKISKKCLGLRKSRLISVIIMSMVFIVFMSNLKAKLSNGRSLKKKIQVLRVNGNLLSSKNLNTSLKSFSELVAGWTTWRL